MKSPSCLRLSPTAAPLLHADSRQMRDPCSQSGAVENAPRRCLRWGTPHTLSSGHAAPGLVSPRLKLEMILASSRQMGGRDKGSQEGLECQLGCHGQCQALLSSHCCHPLAMCSLWDRPVFLDTFGASDLSPWGTPDPLSQGSFQNTNPSDPRHW